MMANNKYIDLLQVVEAHPGITTAELSNALLVTPHRVLQMVNTLAKMPALLIDTTAWKNHYYPIDNGFNLYVTSQNILRRSGKFSLFQRGGWNAAFPSDGAWQ